jgi:hypothetical protein
LIFTAAILTLIFTAADTVSNMAGVIHQTFTKTHPSEVSVRPPPPPPPPERDPPPTHRHTHWSSFHFIPKV